MDKESKLREDYNEYIAARAAWLADKSRNSDIHDRYINARDRVEGFGTDELPALLDTLAALRSREAALTAFVRELAEREFAYNEHYSLERVKSDVVYEWQEAARALLSTLAEGGSGEDAT